MIQKSHEFSQTLLAVIEVHRHSSQQIQNEHEMQYKRDTFTQAFLIQKL
jgi:hypothetical protein